MLTAVPDPQVTTNDSGGYVTVDAIRREKVDTGDVQPDQFDLFK